MLESQYFPAVNQSPIHVFPAEGYGEGLKAVPYSVVAPLALEVPYLEGLAQKVLSDRLVPGSLYGLNVLRTAYTEGARSPASVTATEAVVDSGQAYMNFITDSDVHVCQDHGYYLSHSPECETDGVFICSHHGCVGIEGFGAYFASTEQFIGHWNTFHVALTVGYNCHEAACNYCSVPGPDSLDQFLLHIKMQHSTIWGQGQGECLPKVVEQAQFTGNNPVYWPIATDESCAANCMPLRRVATHQGPDGESHHRATVGCSYHPDEGSTGQENCVRSEGAKEGAKGQTPGSLPELWGQWREED